MIVWNPDPDLFVIPVLNWPVKWYGLLFALGFALGFPIFKDLLFRYFLQNPEFWPSDMTGAMGKWPLEPKSACEGLPDSCVKEFERQAHRSRCRDAGKAIARLCWEEKMGDKILSLKKKALKVCDKLTIYMVVATILGARLGHFLFYERPSDYLRSPMEILRLREGGLASHGAAIAILLALWFFTRFSKKQDPGLNWLRLLDFISVPTALGAGFIRIGNFVNQEILGTPTDLPWSVVFLQPLDGSLPVPRHPVQIYEALFYFAVFFLLWRLSFSRKSLLATGRLIGLFLIFVFVFRFFVEFLKVEQSHLPHGDLMMGQWLSIPFVILGVLILLYSRYRRFRGGRPEGASRLES